MMIGFSYALAKEDKNSMKHYPSFSSSSKIKPADYLYVFDPSSNGLRIHDSLERGNLQWRRQVRKPISAINKSQYQLLYVAEGLMDDAEKERSKILIGISDSSELLASF